MMKIRPGKRRKLTLRVVPTAIIGAITLGVLLIVILGLSVETAHRFRSIKNGWEEYANTADERGVWISDIRGYFGYGGVIHNFKNYVLRQNPVYEVRLRSQIKQLLQTINSYLDAAPEALERDALRRIRAVVQEYSRNISVITDDIALGKHAEQIDADVRIDDTDALMALRKLEHHWVRERRVKLSEIVAALSRGETLVRWQSWIMAGLTALVVMIAGLIYVLMGSALRARNVQLKELQARKIAEVAERKLGWVVEQSPASILITDTKGRIEYVNRKFLELTGYRRNEVIGKTPGFLKSGNTSEDAYRAIWTRLAAGHPWRGVFKNLRKDGSAYWAETQLLPLLGEAGEITNFIGIGEDITEKRHIDEQIAKVQKMEVVGILAGSVAHDFNNVLMTIIGNVELIKLDSEDLDSPKELLISVNHIELASRRARALIQQLLSFARQQPGQPRRVNLHAAILEALELIHVSIPPTIRLTYANAGKGKDKMPEMVTEMDPTAFFQIVMNLCQNAAEAIADRGGDIMLDLARLPPGHADGLVQMPQGALGSVKLTVCDTGPGMSERLVAQVFEPFFSTKPVGKGTGLGLAIVQNCVEEAHGNVTLKSTLHKGSRFTLLFPQFEPQDVNGHVKVGLPRGHEHLLLVDDEEALLYTIRRLLARLGYRVEAYSDPAMALRAFTAHPDAFDAVISDFMMPEMSGVELIVALRKLTPDLPALLMSAYDGGADMPKSLENVLRLRKPVELAEFAGAVRSILEGDTPVG